MMSSPFYPAQTEWNMGLELSSAPTVAAVA